MRAIVAVDGLGIHGPILGEWCIGSEAHREAIALEERALQRSVIVEIGVLQIVNARRATTYLTIGAETEAELKRQTLLQAETVPTGT